MAETFTLANISPQVGPGFNRDYWCVACHVPCTTK